MQGWARTIGLLAALIVALPAGAQESEGFRQTEGVLNAGGTPAQGAEVSSAGFRVTLSSLGGGLHSGGYLPPGEVGGLRFSGPQSLVWNPERSAGTYNVYRDGIDTLPAGAFGACHDPDRGVPSASDATVPAPGAGFFYLVTVENRLGDEGTKGAGRGGFACP